MHLALNKANLDDAKEAMYDALKGGDKARMALDLLFDVEPEKLDVPVYIAEGLKWMEDKLEEASLDFVEGTTAVEDTNNA